MARIGSKPIDDLVRRAIIGDATAFTQLWDAHAEELKTYIQIKFKDLDDFYVDDVVSRSFEKAFRQIGTYDPNVSKFSTWLRVIAKRTALDVCDRLQKENSTLFSIENSALNIGPESYLDVETDSSLDVIIKEEEEMKLQEYIDALPELYREVARKRLIEGLKYQEIAEEMEIELNTVRTRIRRAKAIIDKHRSEDE